jgi:hypothetical protein
MLTQRALEQYRAQDVYWPADLMVALENVRLGLAFEWAAECVKSLVVQAAPPESKERLLNWLAGVHRTNATADGSDLMEEGRRVWHEKRDTIHTAISHLYAARAYLQQSNDSSYRLSVIRAAYVLGDHDYYRQTALAIPLTLFEQFTTGSATAT